MVTFTVLISSFGTRRSRRSRTVPTIRACEQCAGELARVLGRMGMRRETLTLLNEVMPKRHDERQAVLAPDWRATS